jgi:cytochrome P450
VSDSKDLLPTGMELSMLNPKFRECPDAFYERLRTEAPVYQDRGCDRVVLSRAKEIGSVVNDRSLVADPRKARPTSLLRHALGVNETYRPTLAFMDDPDHKRLRSLITKDFNQQTVARLRLKIHEVAERLLDKVAEKRSFDVIEMYAKPLPTITIGMVLGIDEGDQQQVKIWSDTVVSRFDPNLGPEQRLTIQQAKQDLRNYLEQTVKDKLRQPKDDLISKLVARKSEGLVEELEIVELCEFLMVAGNLTTTDMIGNATYALLCNAGEIIKLKERPQLAGGMVEEALRYDPPVTSANRVTTCPMKMDGVEIEEGQNITCLLMSANHDPELHSDPLRFDIERHGNKHYAFGGGSHFCLGAPLARLEGEIAIPLLFQKFPSLRLVSDAIPTRKAIPSSSGWESLWLQTGL